MSWTPERLKALRQAFGETQEEFRIRLPVAISTIRLWETGGTIPPMACNLLERLEREARAQPQPA